MLKPLRNKHLLDVCKALKIKDLTHTPKPLQSHSKATPKTTPKHQTVENQALDEIFWSFGVCSKNHPTKPARPLARFLQARCPFFLYISLSLQKLQKQKSKINQIIDRVGFEGFGVVFGVALEWLWSLLHFCKKHAITKHRPSPTPCPAPP